MQQEPFVPVPWTIESSGLDPYQFRVWVHVKRVGCCWQSVRTIAAACQMSVGKASQTRKWLFKSGYLKKAIDEKTGRMGFVACSPDEQTHQNRSPHERERSPGERSVHVMNTSVHHMNGSRSHEEEHSKKKNEEERSARGHESPNGFWDIPENLRSDGFLRAWRRWLAYVDERGIDFTETQAELTLQELSDHGEAIATKSVVKSIRKGWRNVYIDGSSTQTSQSSNGQHDPNADRKRRLQQELKREGLD